MRRNLFEVGSQELKGTKTIGAQERNAVRTNSHLLRYEAREERVIRLRNPDALRVIEPLLG